jgi:putative two component, sigma54 specific, transcriptional regulator, fis family
MREGSKKRTLAPSLARILLVDDEEAILQTMRSILETEGYAVETASGGREAIELFRNTPCDVALCDVKMQGMDGIELLVALREITPELPVIMISGHGTIDTAVEALKKGAYDYIQKPLDLNRLLVSLRNALERSSLVEETQRLRQRVQQDFELVGESEVIQDVRAMMRRVAATHARVLVTGENGTGKELVARGIHQLSSLASGPFIEVNCAAIPSELIESELFGHEKGAFTSAIKQRKGKFELACDGTLFLDEIGDMSLDAQAKVLRALQEWRITRVGGDKEIEVNPRVIAATNKNLQEEIRAGRFREDLYHRLSVILIHVPPLRERREDIPLLVDRFVTLLCKQNGVSKRKISKEAMATLCEYPWTGNVRELHNIVERLLIMTDGEIVASDVQRYVN